MGSNTSTSTDLVGALVANTGSVCAAGVSGYHSRLAESQLQ